MDRSIMLFAAAGLLNAAFFVAPVGAEISYSEVEGDASFNVVRMTVTPAAAPTPVFAHRLTPEDIDLKSGNAAPYYYRSLMDWPRRMERVRKKYDEDEQLYKWYGTGVEATPIEQLPVDKVRDAVEMSLGGWVWDQLIEATHRRDCEFEFGLDEMRGMELIQIPLEEFQRSRDISRMLALRTRLALAEKRYEDAIATMRVNYRLAENFGSLPFIVSGLIGVAEAGITNGTALELIAQPGSPNLYWAFRELPSPLVDMRSAARFELDFGPRIFPIIHDAATTDRSREEWNRLFTQTFRDLVKSGGELPLFGGDDALKSDFGPGLVATGAALLGYLHAKEQLIAQGFDKDRVEQMSVGQVLAIYTERNYQMFADEWEALWYMPFWEAREREGELEKHIAAARMSSGGPQREVIPLVSFLLPAMQAARRAQARLEREIAALQVIEALRMHAAERGKWPASLDDIRDVPVPINPATGKAFLYRVDGGTAILELPATDGLHGGNRRFEIQLANE